MLSLIHIYLINGNMTKLADAGIFAASGGSGKEEESDEDVLEVEEPDGSESGLSLIHISPIRMYTFCGKIRKSHSHSGQLMMGVKISRFFSEGTIWERIVG